MLAWKGTVTSLRLAGRLFFCRLLLLPPTSGKTRRAQIAVFQNYPKTLILATHLSSKFSILRCTYLLSEQTSIKPSLASVHAADCLAPKGLLEELTQAGEGPWRQWPHLS